MPRVLREPVPCASLAPVFARLPDASGLCWLDSGPRPGRGAVSALAFEPFAVFSARGRRCAVERRGRRDEFEADPFEALGGLLAEFRGGGGFLGPGAFGWVSYDAGRTIERIPSRTDDDLGLPDLWFACCDIAVVRDHDRGETAVVGCECGVPDFAARVRRCVELCSSAGRRPAATPPGTVRAVADSVSFPQYRAAVGRVRSYIASGDVYQVNLAHRLRAEGSFDARSLYLRMRRNRAPFSGFLRTGADALLSNSPELLVRSDGRTVLTRPMKGTRPRGRTPREDRALERELLRSPKDRAELLMIVDLERNDLGRICRTGSVRVPRLRRIERYSTVFQTTADVEGTLLPGTGPADVLRAIFPGGSVTGAPKIRAMEIIEELEPVRRGFYTGSLGWIGFDGAMELSIMIRTMLLRGERLFYPVGGGIVWDSRPDAEYRESLDKARVFFDAVGARLPRRFGREAHGR